MMEEELVGVPVLPLLFLEMRSVGSRKYSTLALPVIKSTALVFAVFTLLLAFTFCFRFRVGVLKLLMLMFGSEELIVCRLSMECTDSVHSLATNRTPI